VIVVALEEKVAGVLSFGKGGFVGIAGFDWDGAGFGGVVAWVCDGVALLLFTPASTSFSTAFLDCCALFKVPFACTSSNILLVDGETGVAWSGAMVDWTAIFFLTVLTVVASAATVFPLFAATFFSFLTSTTLSFAIAFAATFFTAALLAATSGVGPASSATTFFGRPRFLTAGGSIGGFEDIVVIQLVSIQ
jgi:hypothetical protein